VAKKKTNGLAIQQVAEIELPVEVQSGLASAGTGLPKEDPRDAVRREYAPITISRSNEVTFVGVGNHSIWVDDAGKKDPIAITVRFRRENAYRYTTGDERVIEKLRKFGFKEVV
jgi:hypothetical protein